MAKKPLPPEGRRRKGPERDPRVNETSDAKRALPDKSEPPVAKRTRKKDFD
jgi:hypothetical protein